MLWFLSVLSKAPELEFCWLFVFWLPPKFLEEGVTGNSMVLEMVALRKRLWRERTTVSAVSWLAGLRAWASLAGKKQLAFKYLVLGLHYCFLLLLKFCFWGVSFSQSSILDFIVNIAKLLWGQYILTAKDLNRTKRLCNALYTPSSLTLYRSHHLGCPRYCLYDHTPACIDTYFFWMGE